MVSYLIKVFAIKFKLNLKCLQISGSWESILGYLWSKLPPCFWQSYPAVMKCFCTLCMSYIWVWILHMKDFLPASQVSPTRLPLPPHGNIFTGVAKLHTMKENIAMHYNPLQHCTGVHCILCYEAFHYVALRNITLQFTSGHLAPVALGLRKVRGLRPE